MPEVSAYKQGQFSWTDLATSDEKAALKFYGALFGWKDSPQPMGQGLFYHMQQLNGQDVCGINQQQPDEAKMGIPPHWNVYVTVTDVDAIAKKVPEAGGKVVMPPFDVLESGRMAIASDPTGAFICFWEPKRHIGAGVMNEVGSLTWFELVTNDPAKASEFYQKVLGVSAARAEGPMEYTMLRAGGRDVAGVFRITPEMGPVPPSWTVYFRVADCDHAAKKAQALGARVIVPPRDTGPGMGRFAGFTDPQGAAFFVHQRG